ncbi:hypothetical protein KKC88_04605 [Patescibacteria group bacterium]|nr:hypothetical protein [Patescibacteria group bacterium]MBU1674011.1 hypothetical protein [Patescibacteria group bacterium]MBU1963165.1 hypothetical protein [Patescibacteria group bacterium]
MAKSDNREILASFFEQVCESIDSSSDDPVSLMADESFTARSYEVFMALEDDERQAVWEGIMSIVRSKVAKADRLRALIGSLDGHGYGPHGPGGIIERL